jgi:hypothetical protein
VRSSIGRTVRGLRIALWIKRPTLWQRREVNSLLASYGLSLEFPDPDPLRAV